MTETMNGKAKRAYSTGEEIANAVSHGVGVVLSVAGLAILVAFAVVRGTVWHVVGYSIFGMAMFILYTASTVYHAVPLKGAKRVLDIIDHSSIFILIAGTYTAICLTVLRPTSGWWIFGFQWGIAVFGIVMKSLFIERFRNLSTVLYALMGWMVALVWNDFIAAAAPLGVKLLAAGGIAYTGGIVFYALKKVKWCHSIWHLFVLAGTILHFLAMIAFLY